MYFYDDFVFGSIFKKNDQVLMTDFSHIDDTGKPGMVDVGYKENSFRSAMAQSIVGLPNEVAQKLKEDGLNTKKGPLINTAIIAGIMAAKKTGDLIPLCHPLGLENCHIEINFNEENELIITCTATLNGKTGVEMEALVGASMAALTIYDMCKGMSHDIVIKETKLMEKSGGKRAFKRVEI